MGDTLNPTLARWLYYAAQTWRGEPVARVLRELEGTQHWSRDRLLELQWERQRVIARYAYHRVPFYREAWSAIGFSPEDLRDRRDWERLPILEKATVQEAGKDLIAERPPAGQLAPTSGTAGVPTTVMRGHLSWAHVHANKFRQWRWHGVEVGDRYAYFWGLSRDPKDRREAELKDWLFNRERCSAFALSPEYARAFYQRLRERPGRFAYGYPSSMTQFCDELAAQGLDGRRLGWKVAITTSEVVLPEWRERIERTLGCPLADNYGCAETGDAGIECERGGMHVPVESVAVDLLDGSDGLPEMLLTDLFNFSQPMIRYRVGDLLDPAPAATTCPCGRGLPLLGTPIGRAGDNLMLPDGRQVNCHTTTYLFKHHGKAGHVREYQFVQFQGGRVELRIHPGPGWSDGVKGQLEREVQEAFGWPMEVKLVPRFERKGRGKHRDFVRAEDIGES